MLELPIDSLRGEVNRLCAAGVNRFVIAAPTGSGKSTRLPCMFAEECAGAVYILQPRRIAARMLAKRVAQERGLTAGKEVGWQIRFEKNYDENTKIVFLTEGILARRLLSKNGLDGVSAVIFDEFHERNIYSDLSLALALRLQKTSRPDLKIAVCSASMDSDALMNYMGEGSARLECGGRLFNLDISYSPARSLDAYWDDAAREFTRLASSSAEGNFLIFMPGAYEISRTIRAISAAGWAKDFEILPLHGDLPADMQDRVLSPSKKRKAIVCTNIAETSLTVEGVNFVIDSGFARVARYDAARGINTLLVERISLASATQRAGRAGRMADGRVVRLWRQSDEASFDKFTAAEIRRLSLAQITLWLAASSIDIAGVDFLEAPLEKDAADAKELLRSLGALDENSNATALGRSMARIPTEPRYAKLLSEAVRLGCPHEAAFVAALTEVGRVRTELENAFKQSDLDEMLGDVSSELEELSKLCMLASAHKFSEEFCRTYGIHSVNARKVCKLAADFARSVSKTGDVGARFENLSEREIWANVSKCVLSAFPDHLCKRLNEGTLACDIAGGRRGEIRRESRAYAKDVFCAISLREQNIAGKVGILASMVIPVELDDVKSMFSREFEEKDTVEFDEVHKAVIATKLITFKGMALLRQRSSEVPKALAAKMLADDIMSGKLVLKKWDEDADSLVCRINFLARHAPELGYEYIDDEYRRALFEQMCYGCVSYSQVRDMDAKRAILDCLSDSQRASLNFYAPESVSFPNRKKPAQIRYDIPTGRAILSAWFKDLMNYDPAKLRIADGKIKPTFEILAPNGRPIQTTQDLKEFWNTSWLEIAKELKTRYPKHFKI